MGKISEILIESQSWGFSFFQSQKENLEIEKNTWGNRGHLEQIGKKIDEMSWHDKPKRVLSPKTQMELYFGWLKSVTDKRTRRIIAANLIDYYVPIQDEEYQQLKDKNNICFKTVNTLEFDEMSIPFDHPYQMAAVLETDSLGAYTYWLESKDESKRLFAENYGIIKEIKIPMVKRATMTHRFYTLSRAMKYLTKDFAHKEDSYFNTSMTYQKPSTRDFRRLGDRVTEFCLLFSEIDFYKVDAYKEKNQKEVLALIFEELDKFDFPRPTEVVYPRGLHLVWKISPIPAYRFSEWEMMQKKIHLILEKFGSDTQTVTDKVRLLRLAGTIHSKTGKKIWGQTFTDDRYLFNELLMKCCKEEMEKEVQKREWNRKRYLERLEQNFEIIQGGNRVLKQDRKDKPLQNSNYVGNLIHEKYRRDLLHLVNLRGGVMDGYREFSCFLMRYWTLCITGGQTIKAINEMEKLYYSMNIQGEYSFQEVIGYTASAEKAYKKWKENWRKGYNYRNDKLVKFLKISEEEQKTMWILMDDKETKRRQQERDTIKKKKKREINGAVSNEILETTIMKVTQENPELKAYKIAEIVRRRLGKCSETKVRKVWEALNK